MNKNIKLFSFLSLISVALISAGCPVKKVSIETLRNCYLTSDISYQNNIGTLGIGVINPKNYSFDLLLDTLGKQKNQILNIENQEFIIPLIHKPDYQLFYIAVKNVYTDYYEIYANKTATVFVKKDEFDFYEWPDFLMETLSITAEKGYIDRQDPESIVLFDESATYVIKSVDSDWLLVNKELEDGTALEIQEYWVKWRNDDNLLINPIFLM